MLVWGCGWNLLDLLCLPLWHIVLAMDFGFVCTAVVSCIRLFLAGFSL